MNRIKIPQFFILLSLLQICVLADFECQRQQLFLQLLYCQLEYCLYQNNSIQLKSCSSSQFDKQQSGQQSVLYSGNFGNCIRQCCVREDNPPAMLTMEFLTHCSQANHQNYTFDLLRNLAFFAFIIIFSLIVCCRIWKCLKGRSLQPGTCQSKARDCCLKYCCLCCYHEPSVRPQDIYPAQEEIPSQQHLKFKLNQVNDGEQLFNEYDNNFEIDDQQCVICLQNLPNSLTSCRHKFHTNCIREWLQRDWHCPLCKTQRVTPIKVYCNICFKKYVTLEGRSLALNQNLKFVQNKVCINCGHGKNYLKEMHYESAEKVGLSK